MRMMIQISLCAGLALTAAHQSASADTTRPAYGCFKVTAPSLAIKEGAIGTTATLATADKGEILIKRRRFCTVAAGVCAVTTNKGVQGFADKKMMAVAPCPSRLSTKTN